jgi:peptidyl-prolyl cis-trans isomerase C
MYKSALLYGTLFSCALTFQTATAAEEAKSDETKAPDAVATVNGKPISQQTYDDYIKAFPPAPPGVNVAPDRQVVINELVNRELVVQDAADKGLDKDSLFLKQLEAMRYNALYAFGIQKYLETHPVSEDRLREEYSKFKPIQQYKARHSMVNTQEEGANLINQLSQGANFAQLALQYSTDQTSKPNGGDLGWFTKDQMTAINPPFAEAVVTMEKGKLAPQPVQSKLGWHVVLLEDMRDLPPIPFEGARPQLMATVQQQLIMEYLKGLKEKGKVEMTTK